MSKKGQEPLPYTADEIMLLAECLIQDIKSEGDGGKGDRKGTLADLRKIAERYEYMNMHFNPPKSLIKEEEYHFPYCDKEAL